MSVNKIAKIGKPKIPINTNNQIGNVTILKPPYYDKGLFPTPY